MADDTRAPTRRRILDTAFALFIEHGYHRTSVRAIAEQLGISKAAVLYHFPAKADILTALAEPFLAEYEEALLAAARLGPRRAPWAVIEGILDVLLAHRHLLRLSMHDLALVAPGPVFDRFTAAMGLAHRLVAGDDPSFARRVRASQAVSILGDPVVLFADEPTERLRTEILKGLRLLVGPDGLADTEAGRQEPAPRRGRGRPQRLSEADAARVRRWHAAGELSVAEIARRLGVSRATVYRCLENDKLCDICETICETAVSPPEMRAAIRDASVIVIRWRGCVARPSPGGMPLSQPQMVLAPPAKAAVFLVVTIAPGGEEVVRDLLSDIAALRRTVGFRVPDGELSCVVGIGSAAWDRLFSGPRPRELHPFQQLEGPRHRAPATAGDLLFHLRARRMDLCFELARLITRRLGAAVAVADEVHGFKYFDERDLLGFVDGTENPDGSDAADAVFVGDEDPDFAGGSYVIVQKYLHDLAAWEALSADEQARVIGRTKWDNVELDDDVKPADSHVALNTITDDDGTERKIVRDNLAFGRAGHGEFGTYFIGYAGVADVIERMLRNMFLGDVPGRHDRILDFSTAVTGCLFHVPTADFLDDLPAPPAVVAASGDGTLGIGSLKGAQ